MKKLPLIALLAALAWPAHATDVNQTLDAAANGNVHISNIAGSVSVNGWSRNSVEVTGTLGRNVEKLIFERDGDDILIKVKVPRKGGRGIDSDLSIHVPQGSSIDVGTVSADIEVSDVKGEQSLHTVSGDVDTEYNGAEISAESVSGDVEIQGDKSDGEVRANSVSGDVTVFRASGEIYAGSVSGDLVVDEGDYSDAELNTVNGEILFTAKLSEKGRMSIESVNGDVDIVFDGKLHADVDIETLNGDIDNCFGPDARRVSKWGPGMELSFKAGDGSGRLDITTVNGDIEICDD